MIIGIDAGNSEVKIAGPLGLSKFPSTIGAYRERKLTNAPSKHDMIVEYKGRKVFAGTLAEESFLGGAIMGDSKAHEDALLRILIAMHKYSNSNFYEVVVGQPIGKHTDKEKREIKSMLLDDHTLTINGDTKRFRITRAEVAAEGGAAFWSAPVDGLVRIVDVGSGTVNCASLKDKRYLDKGSFGLSFGKETAGTDDFNEIARSIYANTTAKQWDKNDKVLLVGGCAQDLIHAMRVYYPNAEIIAPVHSIFANAVGFYAIGMSVFAT